MTTCSTACGQMPAAPGREELTACPDRAQLARSLILALLLSLIFVPEYMQGAGELASKSVLYSPAFGGLRIIDVLLFLVFSAHAFALACLRDTHGHLPRTLKFIVCGFGLAIAISFVYGAEHSGHNFFFDWRALALGLGFYITYRFWVQMPAEAKQAVQIFAVVASLRILVLLAAYLLGLGDSLLGVRIPTFDGPTISTAVFTALLGISMSSFTSGVAKRVAWLLFATVAMILVVICFRRTYWAELALGMAIMAVVGTRHRLRGLVLLACIAGVGWLAMGPSLMDRLTSFDFTSSDNPYATDNVDHVGDVLDAWDQVRASR